jgi:hypothetical protein
LRSHSTHLLLAAITAHKERTAADGPSPALKLQVPFDEAAVWGENAEYVRKALDIPNVVILRVEDGA